MHLFLGATGFRGIEKKTVIDKIMKDIIKKHIDSEENDIMYAYTPLKGEKNLYYAQIKHYFSERTGIYINGIYNPVKNAFKMEYYYPFLDGSTVDKENEISFARKTDKEAYNVLCDDNRRGIALIFTLLNLVDYLNKGNGKTDFENKEVRLSALSTEGRIIMPVKKTQKQINKCKAATTNRNNLLDLAKKGDTSAMDTLTLGDMDTYTDIYKRVKKEDIFSIVDSSFMPSGLECDVYSVIGNIKNCVMQTNSCTQEQMCIMTLECNDIEMDVCINMQDLVGEPKIGRRFKGKVWLQGSVEL